MKVDLEALFVAFSDDSVERSYYLDGDSGRVFNVLEDHDDPETRELVRKILHSVPDGDKRPSRGRGLFGPLFRRKGERKA